MLFDCRNCKITVKNTEVKMAEYEALDINEIQNEYKRINSSKNNSNEEYLNKYVQFPDKEGFLELRILPRRKGEKLFCVTRLHTLTNPSNGRKFSYHCPKNLTIDNKGKERWVGDCIICKYYSDLWQKSESLSGKAQEDLQNQARSIKPNERYYYNVIVRAEKDKNGNVTKNSGPKVFSCGEKTHEKILRAIRGDEAIKEKGLGDVTHPLTGRDFKYIKKMAKSGNNEYPNYDQSKFEDESPLGTPDEIKQWIDNLWNLQELRTIKSSEELKHALRVHLGMVQEEVQDDELEEFRSYGKPEAKKEVKKEPLREELVFTTPSTETVTVSSDDILADDDFMKQLEE